MKARLTYLIVNKIPGLMFPMSATAETSPPGGRP